MIFRSAVQRWTSCRGGGGGRGGTSKWMLADNKRACNGMNLVRNRSALKRCGFYGGAKLSLFFLPDIFHLGAREEGGTSTGGAGAPSSRTAWQNRCLLPLVLQFPWAASPFQNYIILQPPTIKKPVEGKKKKKKPSSFLFNSFILLHWGRKKKKKSRRALASHGMTPIRRNALGVKPSPGSLTWLRRERVPIHSAGRRTFSN